MGKLIIPKELIIQKENEASHHLEKCGMKKGEAEKTAKTVIEAAVLMMCVRESIRKDTGACEEEANKAAVKKVTEKIAAEVDALRMRSEDNGPILVEKAVNLAAKVSAAVRLDGIEVAENDGEEIDAKEVRVVAHIVKEVILSVLIEAEWNDFVRISKSGSLMMRITSAIGSNNMADTSAIRRNLIERLNARKNDNAIGTKEETEANIYADLIADKIEIKDVEKEKIARTIREALLEVGADATSEELAGLGVGIKIVRAIEILMSEKDKSIADAVAEAQEEIKAKVKVQGEERREEKSLASNHGLENTL